MRPRPLAPRLILAGLAGALVWGGIAAGAAGPTGSAGAIALAERAGRAYTNVPGVELDTTGHLSDGTPVSSTFRVALSGGAATKVQGRIMAAGTSAVLVEDATGSFGRIAGSRCWSPTADLGIVGSRAIPLRGRFATPRRVGGTLVFRVTDGKQVSDYVVDRRTGLLRVHRVVSPRPSPEEVGRWRNLDGAPSVATPSPRCPS